MPHTTTAILARTETKVDGELAAIRRLARQGVLAATAAAASPPEQTRLTGAAYQLAAPIVYERLTRRIERRRGHGECTRSMTRLADDCRDRFHDDVESVVDDVLAHASKPIDNLEGWLTKRLTAATVDGHRKRRGRRGALQRPRLPGWLADALGHDRWLTTLAIDLLLWVGVPATAGAQVWPLETWALRRATITQDWSSDQASVVADVDLVLAAMRTNPKWYADHVETPLGHKQPPVAPPPPPDGEHMVLSLADPDAAQDTHLHELATAALSQIELRINRGEDHEVVVPDVVGAVFGSGSGHHELDRPPHVTAPYEELVRALLADPATVRRITRVACSIVAHE